MVRQREVDSLSREQQVVRRDHTLKEIHPFGGLFGRVLMDQDDVRTSGHLTRPAECAEEWLEIGVRARFRQACQDRDHSCGRLVTGIRLMSRLEHRFGLRCESILQCPPRGRCSGFGSSRKCNGFSRLPLTFRPMAGNDRSKIVLEEFKGSAGDVDSNARPVRRHRNLGLRALGKIDQVRSNGRTSCKPADAPYTYAHQN